MLQTVCWGFSKKGHKILLVDLPFPDVTSVSGNFQGPSRTWDPYQYYSHTTPIRIPKDMGMVWVPRTRRGVPGIWLRSGFVIVLLLSFFAFAPQLRWLMRSPLILQFQMLGRKGVLHLGSVVWKLCFLGGREKGRHNPKGKRNSQLQSVNGGFFWGEKCILYNYIVPL